MIDNEVFTRKTVAFHTLGCKLNFSETSEMARRMQESGFDRVDFDDVADIYVINTCSVTEEANKKCRQVIKRCIRRNNNAFVVVTGCYAQLEAKQVADIDGVSLVIGNNEKNDIVDLIGNACRTDSARIEAGNILKDKRFQPSFSSGDRTRSFLKIQDGCDYFCTYCTIPFARGTSRSDTVENTIAEARRAAHAGAKEVILTGVNIGDFGRNNGETFEQLVEALEDVEGIERYRISSIEPNLLTDSILKHVAQSQKFMPHFHVPLQSGSNAVLQMMHRRYSAEFFADKIASIRSLIHRAFVGIDVIVGVNGETPEYFEETRQLLEGIDFSQLHVFTYSERPGTLALRLKPIVDIPERHRRNAVLHELSEQKRIAFYKRFIGTEATVLFESSEHEGRMSGFTDNYLKVDLPYDASLSNTIHRVRIDSLTIDKSAVCVSVLD
ncbi:MAG: tRNA (N(6)-L-threonylcarbamoyladenosine(37)-C(2))-methylthiotransferase MtaB [Bacteroidales bacterium]|jgi:threonylcarbamoyladenosine tRNA methylthiotransferase MtaB|nr:tRNA (N(6)-L-threonylcarbamoyladenosine(37)-C(2))-methylthiotransferase MtaB [Bacteroidales bacterium]